MPSEGHSAKEYKMKDEHGEWKVKEGSSGTVRILMKPSGELKKKEESKGNPSPVELFYSKDELEKRFPGVSDRRMKNL